MSTYVNAEQRMDAMTGQAKELAKLLHELPRGHNLATIIEHADDDTLEVLKRLRSRVDSYLTEHTETE